MQQYEKDVIMYCHNRFRESEKEGKTLTKEVLLQEVIQRTRIIVQKDDKK